MISSNKQLLSFSLLTYLIFLGAWPFQVQQKQNALIEVATATQPIEMVSLNGNDGPKEPAAYYLVGGDANSFTAGDFELVQKDKAFSPQVLSAPLGSTISFPNRDSFTHNVYSPEGAMGFFDLGTAGTTDAGNSNLIKKAFSTEGVVKVSCAVHPIMQAHIFIVPSKYHSASNDGSYSFPQVPSGTYNLMVIKGSGAASKLKSVTL